MIQLIVFDCDGVMFDSRQANHAYYNSLLHHVGYPPMTADELEYVHMHSVDASVAHIFRNHPEISLDDVHTFRREQGYEPFLPYMKIEDDLIEFLDRIKDRYQLAISTNRSDTMQSLLQLFSLEDYFDKVVTSATAKRPKPAPDGLIEILHHFHCPPEKAIFVGDSILDRQQSAACNVALIAFKNTELTAEYHVDSFMEILTLPPFAHG